MVCIYIQNKCFLFQFSHCKRDIVEVAETSEEIFSSMMAWWADKGKGKLLFQQRHLRGIECCSACQFCKIKRISAEFVVWKIGASLGVFFYRFNVGNTVYYIQVLFRYCSCFYCGIS